MPAIELGLADYLGVWGRRQIILKWPKAELHNGQLRSSALGCEPLLAISQDFVPLCIVERLYKSRQYGCLERAEPANNRNMISFRRLS